MNMEHSMESKLAGETKVLGENLPRCEFVHYKSYMLNQGCNIGRRGGKPAASCLSYDTSNLLLIISLSSSSSGNDGSFE
jgi:hypothetical protein